MGEFNARQTTVVRNIDWLIAWDGASQSHVYLRDVDLVFAGTEITHIESGFSGPSDRDIDGRQSFVFPGLINVHSHPNGEALRKGITDEVLSPGFWHTSLYEFLTVYNPDADGAKAGLQVALAELLKSGVTTIADLSMPFDGWLDILADSGIRAVAAPMFRDARWRPLNGHQLAYDWDEGEGQEMFAEAKRVLDLAAQHPSGRLSGMVSPAQVDTSSPNLITDSYQYAESRNLPYTIHTAQSVFEFHEMVRRHGVSPIQWLNEVGGLGPLSLLGHGIFLDSHPWVHWSTNIDMDLLAESGASIAHCPTVFSRRGITLRTVGEYLRAGVNLGIGTDTYPHNFLEEMRTAAIAARITAGTVSDLESRDIFNMATTGGAKALRLDDVGHLSVGAKADFVMVDTKHPSMMPLREPLRSLLYVAADRAVRDVFVDGLQVVKDGDPVHIDLQAASEALQAAQERCLTAVPSLDWAGRGADEMAPMVFETATALD